MTSQQIFNTDQGPQFTSPAFTGKLEPAGTSTNMDEKGRVFDNIFIERLWRSVKYEDVYIKDYQIVNDAVDGIGAYFKFLQSGTVTPVVELQATRRDI